MTLPYEMGDTDGTGIISYGSKVIHKRADNLQIANHLITINDDDHGSFGTIHQRAVLKMKIVMTAAHLVMVDKLLSQQD